ncbi:unnamed protein product [Moneuplotes crassus]|uniref:Uncharacterized protein n=1 Tax=Euplotes crassus TaxID=5936 RepID=A0AAD1X7X1_EUPCR|nr:unnamed protein product [Moneuplotes crassus]
MKDHQTLNIAPYCETGHHKRRTMKSDPKGFKARSMITSSLTKGISFCDRFRRTGTLFDTNKAKSIEEEESESSLERKIRYFYSPYNKLGNYKPYMKFEFEELDDGHIQNIPVNPKRKSTWNKLSNIIMEDSKTLKKFIKNISQRDIPSLASFSPSVKSKVKEKKSRASLTPYKEVPIVKKLRVSRFRKPNVFRKRKITMKQPKTRFLVPEKKEVFESTASSENTIAVRPFSPIIRRKKLLEDIDEIKIVKESCENPLNLLSCRPGMVLPNSSASPIGSPIKNSFKKSLSSKKKQLKTAYSPTLFTRVRRRVKFHSTKLQAFINAKTLSPQNNT